MLPNLPNLFHLSPITPIIPKFPITPIYFCFVGFEAVSLLRTKLARWARRSRYSLICKKKVFVSFAFGNLH